MKSSAGSLLLCICLVFALVNWWPYVHQMLIYKHSASQYARRYYENVAEAGRWDLPKNGKVQTIPIHPELLQVLRVADD